MCFSKTCPFTYLNFSWCNNGILTKDHTGNTAPTRAKIIPHLRVETPENHTLSGGPYLSRVNMRVNPSPHGYIVHNNWLRAHQSRTECSAYWSQPHPPWNEFVSFCFVLSKLCPVNQEIKGCSAPQIFSNGRCPPSSCLLAVLAMF